MSLFKKRIFLDYASATPLRAEVKSAMKEAGFYNPSAIYAEGREVRGKIEDGRRRIAKILHVQARDVVFTSGGTESDNLAILGVFEAIRETQSKPHIIISNLEHSAITEAAKEVEKRGGEVTIIEADENFYISPERVAAEVRENTILVSISYVHNETGAIQPVGKISRAVKKVNPKTYFHTDASQATLLNLDVSTLGADLLTLDAGKIYGPKSMGLIVVRPNVKISARSFGGGQEKGLRPGTENASHILGFAKALELIREDTDELKRLQTLREEFIKEIKNIPGIVINGKDAIGIISVSFKGKLHELIAIALEEKGVLVSTGSSCLSNKNIDTEALRFSFGRNTTKGDVKTASRILREVMII